jgi:hypothetical protein
MITTMNIIIYYDYDYYDYYDYYYDYYFTIILLLSSSLLVS